MATLGRDIDFGDEAGLAHGVRPGFPAFGPAVGGFVFVERRGGIGEVVTVPDVPAGGAVYGKGNRTFFGFRGD